MWFSQQVAVTTPESLSEMQILLHTPKSEKKSETETKLLEIELIYVLKVFQVSVMD